MLKYPIGIQTFANIIEGGYVYVDKTKQVYDLVDSGKYYFLSRPRRFGKSLLVSTLEAYFKGNKELFKGLAIENLEKDWESYPVLHLDLSPENYSSPERLEGFISNALLIWEKEFGSSPAEDTISLRFNGIIKRAYEKTGKQVVVLVDEYDAPLVTQIGNESVLESNRTVLSSFYKNIKANDAYIKFALLTGVTKFGHVNVFSALNNLMDISMDERFQAICGITEEELHANFDEGVAEMAERQGISKDECYGKLKFMYDGYHFVPNGVGIYNPFSVLNALSSKNFGSYWFRTGTPTALMLALRDTKQDISNLNDLAVRAESLENIFDYQKDIIPLLYQSGYLTIKGSFPNNVLRLGFPNREVEDGFVNRLVPIYSSYGGVKVDSLMARLYLSLYDGDIASFISEIQGFLAGMYYEFFENTEQTFQSVFYIVSVLIGVDTKPELHTSRGRIDLLTKTKDYIYIFEFKYDGTPEEALKQIHEKGYADQFKTDPRKKFLVGVNFDSKLRNIPDDGWKVEEMG